MTDTKPIRRIAIIGTGVIGASWTALFLAKGLQVVATDIAPNAETALRKFVETAWPALKRLGLVPGASQSNLKFTAAIAQAVEYLVRHPEEAEKMGRRGQEAVRNRYNWTSEERKLIELYEALLNSPCAA